LPRAIAEDGYLWLARRVFFREERAAEKSFSAEHLQESRLRAEAVKTLGLFETGEYGLAALGDGHLLERVILLLNVDVLAGRRPIHEDTDGGRVQPDVGETLRVRVSERTQEEGVNDTEDGSIGPNADRQRGDDD
jgi:hypothetical protein